MVSLLPAPSHTRAQQNPTPPTLSLRLFCGSARRLCARAAFSLFARAGNRARALLHVRAFASPSPTSAYTHILCSNLVPAAACKKRTAPLCSTHPSCPAPGDPPGSCPAPAVAVVTRPPSGALKGASRVCAPLSSLRPQRYGGRPSFATYESVSYFAAPHPALLLSLC